MTVDEALETVLQRCSDGPSGPNYDPDLLMAYSALSRYVERVRKLEHELATPLAPYRQTVRMELAAAREGRGDCPLHGWGSAEQSYD